MQAIQRCIAIMEALRKQDPTSVVVRHQIAMAYEYQGKVWMQLGSYDKAIALYRRSQDMCEALAAADPADMVTRSQILVDYGARSEALARQGSMDDAIREARKMIALAAEYQKGPVGLSAKSGAISHHALGKVFAIGRRWPEARDAFQASVAAWRNLPNAEAYRGFVPGPPDAEAGLREAVKHAGNSADPLR
jgi:tetratricopeptide (TPR) repeat protein